MALHSMFAPMQTMELLLELVERRARANDLGEVIELIDSLRVQVRSLNRTARNLVADESHDSPPSVKFPATDLSKVIQAVLEEMAPLARSKHITFVSRWDADSFALISRSDFETIFANLLHNAIKYSYPGTKVKISQAGNRIDVTSYGIGIPDSEHDLVFSRGFRSAAAVKLEYSSVGLGLTTARELAERWAEPYRSSVLRR